MSVVIWRSRPSSKLPVQVNPKYAVTSTTIPRLCARSSSDLRLPLGFSRFHQGSLEPLLRLRQLPGEVALHRPA
jgi:hypothetical protein